MKINETKMKQYKEELHNPKLRFAGSSNQRVIDVQESLKQNEVVLLKDNNELVGA